MEFTNRIFDFVRDHSPEIWQQIIYSIQPHKISAVKRIFQEHLKFVEDLHIFNEYTHNLPYFLLQFCKSIQRNFLSPGDPYGILVTCRASKIYTQDILDKRHLKETPLNNATYCINADLHFELYIYTNLSQIYEITNKRKYITLFVQNYTVQNLFDLFPADTTCYLTAPNVPQKALSASNEYVYINFQKFIITESFVSNYLKILFKPQYRSFVLKCINPTRIVAISDLKYVYEKCGIVCYFFNLIQICKLQFFKNMILESKHETDIINILKYQCYTGQLLPLNRNGLRKNTNRSGLDKLSFEAIKQNYISESIKNYQYPVQTSIDKIFFGQQFNEGTGYTFALQPK